VRRGKKEGVEGAIFFFAAGGKTEQNHFQIPELGDESRTGGEEKKWENGKISCRVMRREGGGERPVREALSIPTILALNEAHRPGEGGGERTKKAS